MKATFSFFSRNVEIKSINLQSKLNAQLSEFAWTLRSLVWVVFNNFLLIDATYRNTISSDQKSLKFAVSL